MTATADRFGRTVIPKKLRDRLGIKPGSEITAEEGNGSITLSAVESYPQMRIGEERIRELIDRIGL